MADEYDSTSNTFRKPYSPYTQSRSALRDKFGTRRIGGTATASPMDAGRNSLGLTDEAEWTRRFDPVAAQPMFGVRPAVPIQRGRSLSSMGVTGGDKASEAESTPIGLPAANPQAAAMVSGLSTPPPALPRPTDYLQSAFDKSTKFWNQMGVRVPTPMAGSVPAGTSFQNSYGTGSVASASENKFRRLLKDSDANLPHLFDL